MVGSNELISFRSLAFKTNECTNQRRRRRKKRTRGKRGHLFHDHHRCRRLLFESLSLAALDNFTMANEEDECDSSRLLTVASPSDVTSFLYAQAAKITSASTSMSDDEDDDDGDLHYVSNPLARSAQVSPPTKMPSHPSLSRSCFAAISSSSSQKANSSDDLTE